jgi:hypothetical protein
VIKLKWVCCLQQSQQFIGSQSDIFYESNSIFYDEYDESLIGTETCSKCGANYACLMIVEFTFPRIYFHIPISAENHNRFNSMEVILKEDIYLAKESNLVLVERELRNQSVWEWENITEEMWQNI